MEMHQLLPLGDCPKVLLFAVLTPNRETLVPSVIAPKQLGTVMFQTVTSHWIKAGSYRYKKNYRIGSRELMVFIQTFPEWWFPLKTTWVYEAVADAVPPLYVYHLFSTRFRHRPRRMLDLYAGVGGWLLGVALYTDRGFYYEGVEIDKRRCRVLENGLRRLRRYHYIDIEFNLFCGDARGYEPSDWFDLVTGSPPCEDVTPLRRLAKGRAAGTYPLTQRYIELVSQIHPSLALYENVPDEKLAKMLRDAGFIVEEHTMDKIIPQRRRRIIAYKRDNTETLLGHG